MPDAPAAAVSPLDAPIAPATADLDFATLYRTHFAFVWRSLRRMGVADEALDDAAQEVFITAHRGMASFEGRSSWKTWLFGILFNTARHHRRARARRPVHEPMDESLSEDPHATPHEAAVRAQARAVLHRFLDGLDDDLRAVFVMSELEQMTAPEVAAATGANLHTVYSRIRAARQQFEQMVARHRARDPWSRP